MEGDPLSREWQGHGSCRVPSDSLDYDPTLCEGTHPTCVLADNSWQPGGPNSRAESHSPLAPSPQDCVKLRGRYKVAT